MMDWLNRPRTRKETLKEIMPFAIIFGLLVGLVLGITIGAISSTTNDFHGVQITNETCSESYRGVMVCRVLISGDSLRGYYNFGESKLYLNYTNEDWFLRDDNILKHEYCHYTQWSRGVENPGFWEEIECYIAGIT